MEATDTLKDVRPQSQSALSPVLLWVLLAALVLRVVTAVMDRAGKDGPGLVDWESRSRASSAAARMGRPVLYEFTAAWCKPCHMLDADWEDKTVAGLVNTRFVPVRVVDRMREDGRNTPDISELQQRYEISAFPTLVIAGPDGQLIAKREGYRDREALIAFLGETASGSGSAGPPNPGS